MAWPGRQLRAKGWTCPIVHATQVEDHAEQMATMLATKSQEALGLLKQHLTRSLSCLIGDLTRIEVAVPAGGKAWNAAAEDIASPPGQFPVESPAGQLVENRFGAGGGQSELEEEDGDHGALVWR